MELPLYENMIVCIKIYSSYKCNQWVDKFKKYELLDDYEEEYNCD